MTIKVRDAASALRTVDSMKVRDAGGALRMIAFVRVRGPDGALREVFTAGGGAPAGNPTYINPGSISEAAALPNRSAYFTASSSAGAVSAYSWGVIDGPGTVISGATAATAQLRVSAIAGDTVTATFYCDIVIGGATYRATCEFTFQNTSGGRPSEQLQ